MEHVTGGSHSAQPSKVKESSSTPMKKANFDSASSWRNDYGRLFAQNIDLSRKLGETNKQLAYHGEQRRHLLEQRAQAVQLLTEANRPSTSAFDEWKRRSA